MKAFLIGIAVAIKRICIKNWEIIAQNGDRFKVERGKEYLTSNEKNKEVIVFSNYWVSIPVSCFAGEQKFTD